MLNYKIGRDSRNTIFEDRRTAVIQSKMLEEKNTSQKLPHQERIIRVQAEISDTLVKIQVDYRTLKELQPRRMHKHSRQTRIRIYRRPPNESQDSRRMFQQSEIFGDALFAVWYIMLRDRKTRSPFYGVMKAEKLLATYNEIASMCVNSDEIDTISSYINTESLCTCSEIQKEGKKVSDHVFKAYLLDILTSHPQHEFTSRHKTC